jgi:hypothetical protein
VPPKASLTNSTKVPVPEYDEVEMGDYDPSPARGNMDVFMTKFGKSRKTGPSSLLFWTVRSRQFSEHEQDMSYT